MDRLSRDLTHRFGRGFGLSNLFQMRAFYLAYPEIFQTLSGKSAPDVDSGQTGLPLFRPDAVEVLLPHGVGRVGRRELVQHEVLSGHDGVDLPRLDAHLVVAGKSRTPVIVDCRNIIGKVLDGTELVVLGKGES